MILDVYCSSLHLFFAALLEKEDNDLGGPQRLYLHLRFQASTIFGSYCRLAVGLYKSHRVENPK